MLKTNPLNPNEADLSMAAQITCFTCGATDATHANSKAQAVGRFYALGWRATETPSEITATVCPKCLKELRELDAKGEL